jgi:Na+/proline symporter
MAQQADKAETRQPTGRDYGCGLVAVLAAVMLTGSVVGVVAALYTHGLSFSLIVGATFGLLFWYWIAMGAWRRTTWSSRR